MRWNALLECKTGLGIVIIYNIHEFYSVGLCCMKRKMSILNCKYRACVKLTVAEYLFVWPYWCYKLTQSIPLVSFMHLHLHNHDIVNSLYNTIINKHINTAVYTYGRTPTSRWSGVAVELRTLSVMYQYRSSLTWSLSLGVSVKSTLHPRSL